ncbi:MAG: hypothetical protein WHX52_02425 [Anaerolineae bacterium]
MGLIVGVEDGNIVGSSINGGIGVSNSDSVRGVSTIVSITLDEGQQLVNKSTNNMQAKTSLHLFTVISLSKYVEQYRSTKYFTLGQIVCTAEYAESAEK